MNPGFHYRFCHTALGKVRTKSGMKSVSLRLVIKTAHDAYTSRTLPRTLVHTETCLSIMKQAHNPEQQLWPHGDKTEIGGMHLP